LVSENPDSDGFYTLGAYNTAPVISGSDTDLGFKTEGFAQNSIDSYKSFVSKRALLSEKIKDNKIIEYGEDATETKEYDKQPINNIVDNVEKSDIKNENNINIVNNNVIENNTSENNTSKINKNKIIEPNVKIDKIEIDIGKDSPQEAESFIKNYGNFSPIIKIKDELINTGDILSYWYSVNYNQLPVIVIKINDSFNRFKALFNDVFKSVEGFLCPIIKAQGT
jgi:hypothetical protein